MSSANTLVIMDRYPSSDTLEAVGRAVTRRTCVNRVIRTHFTWECEDEMSSQCKVIAQ